jgi:hypothetical protein
VNGEVIYGRIKNSRRAKRFLVQIRKLVTPPLPNEFEFIKWIISRKSNLFLSKIRAIFVGPLAGKERFSDN